MVISRVTSATVATISRRLAVARSNHNAGPTRILSPPVTAVPELLRTLPADGVFHRMANKDSPCCSSMGRGGALQTWGTISALRCVILRGCPTLCVECAKGVKRKFSEWDIGQPWPKVHFPGVGIIWLPTVSILSNSDRSNISHQNRLAFPAERLVTSRVSELPISRRGFAA